uniref:NADH dehydrogenase subunit 5 n=1 Tax=Ergasilus tumidus TaxID=342420 RepID=UPI002435C427|nr:NADH dehydrogenase subunit 5 [Ergasilus tumidus]WEU66996.1 NADH dehydrogenase subunit 5 [Ergasilus tumidus]
MMNMKLNQFVLTISLLIMSIVGALLISVSMYIFKEALVLEWEIMNLLGKPLEFVVLLDLYSMLFFSSVMIIALSVFMFSYSYMSSDNFSLRFHLILLAFVMSMVLLIFSPNLVSVMIGWDGLGMSSYLLVIYYASEKSFKAGMITALTNRIGDAFLIVFIGMSFYMFSLSPSLIFSSMTFNSLILSILFLMAVSTKSAQVPFSAWLPAAMAAPTPVSALVHSSTLVTAGVYLMFRFSMIYSNSVSSDGLMWVGGLTMILASMSALSEMDMKKMVALSTLSQLGVMTLALGAGLPRLGFLHLLAHAFFKALLFLSTGSLIHACGSYQDMRKSGSVMEVMPFSSSIMLVCLFSLMGLPFMVSFYSKETIIETMMIMNKNLIPFMMMILGVLMTGVYSMRMFFTVLMMNSKQLTIHVKSDNDSLVNLSMLFLLTPACCGGTVLNSVFFNQQLLTISVIQLKLVIYSLLTLGLISLLSAGVTNYSKYKSIQMTFANMWNLPILSPSLPMNSLGFKGVGLNHIVDYSWLYSTTSQGVLSASNYMSANSIMFMTNKFSRLISLSLVFGGLLFM